MNAWGSRSLEVRAGLCAPLIKLVDAVLVVQDCSLLDGIRSDEQQAIEKAEGRSDLGPGESKHNTRPSQAVDMVPYPVIWPESEPVDSRERELIWYRLYMFAGIVRAVAFQLDIVIRQGVDWDGDLMFNDQKFFDAPHVEVIL